MINFPVHDCPNCRGMTLPVQFEDFPVEKTRVEEKPAFMKQEQSHSSSWLGTAVKIGFVGGLMYGAYWYGASQAAKAAGEAFENIFEGLASATSETQNAFFEALKHHGTVVERGGEHLANTTTTALQTGSNALSTLGTSVSFNGELARGFASRVLQHTSGPNLNVMAPLRDGMLVVQEYADSALWWTKAAAGGAGLVVVTQAANTAIAIAKPVFHVLGYGVKGAATILKPVTWVFARRFPQ